MFPKKFTDLFVCFLNSHAKMIESVRGALGGL